MDEIRLGVAHMPERLHDTLGPITPRHQPGSLPSLLLAMPSTFGEVIRLHSVEACKVDGTRGHGGQGMHGLLCCQSPARMPSSCTSANFCRASAHLAGVGQQQQLAVPPRRRHLAHSGCKVGGQQLLLHCTGWGKEGGKEVERRESGVSREGRIVHIMHQKAAPWHRTWQTVL